MKMWAVFALGAVVGFALAVVMIFGFFGLLVYWKHEGDEEIRD